jgi:ribose transport system substrate-binding protein
VRLAVFTKNYTNPAYAAARLGAERAACRLGATVTHYVPRKSDDIKEQTALIHEALSMRPDAFIFVPVDFKAMNEAMNRVHAAGIPVVSYLNRLSTGKTVTFVGVDDYRLGREVAAYLARHLAGHGNIVLMKGPPGSLTSADRMRGFQETLKRHPGIKVLATLMGDYQHLAGRHVMEEFLASSQVPLDAVLAANDSMALGAIEALRMHARQMRVIGVNAIPEAIDAIKRGTLLATADFDTLKIACVAVEACIRHLQGEPLPPEIILPIIPHGTVR